MSSMLEAMEDTYTLAGWWEPLVQMNGSRMPTVGERKQIMYDASAMAEAHPLPSLAGRLHFEMQRQTDRWMLAHPVAATKRTHSFLYRLAWALGKTLRKAVAL